MRSFEPLPQGPPSGGGFLAASPPRPGPNPPRPDQTTDDVTLNWQRLNVFGNLGHHWYTSVVTWWAVFVVAIIAVMLVFSGLCFRTGSFP